MMINSEEALGIAQEHVSEVLARELVSILLDLQTQGVNLLRYVRDPESTQDASYVLTTLLDDSPEAFKRILLTWNMSLDKVAEIVKVIEEVSTHLSSL